MRRVGANIVVSIAAPFVVLGWTNNRIAAWLMRLAERIRTGGCP
jgi:hypothetical protein